MPIVKFIISSLPPLKNPKVVDYACGAGHFLNEYTTVNPDSTIVGIEKEYRLSKVAKVSSFMYGSEMDIIYEDALRHNPKVKNGSFDVLVANPPYSVKGFLETLSDEERRRYALTETVDEKSFASSNAIECFFIERAAQLLDKDGVAGIIVPSSILNKGSQSITASKGNVYVRTREILLKYFDIVAIAEFGSGTFGKTGTNTVTLFLRRRCDTANLAGTFAELASKLYECEYANGTDFAAVLKEKNLLEKYCEHIGIELPIYETLLCRELDEAIFVHDTFGEYKAAFEKLSETKNRRKKKSYKVLSKEEKEEVERKELMKYMRLVEKEKFYYFALAYKNASEVLIIKSPSGTNENKKFLGYEWSSAKGNEGIKYLAGSRVEVEDETLDEEDKRILENLEGLKSINTPLYNPRNLHDSHKINTLIRTNFARHSGLDPESTDIPEALKPFVTRARLTDMLDFSRVEFDKAITLSPAKKVEIESKYPLVKLGEFSEVIAGQSPKGEYYNENAKGLPFYQGKKDFGDIYLNSPVVWTTHITKESIKNDLLMSVRAPVGDVNLNPFDKICIGRGLAAIRTNELKTQKYLFEFITTNKELFKGNTGTTFESISTADLRNIKVPLPPLDIQEAIVAACERVDDEVAKTNETIETNEQEIIS
ncbi:MAG TPA: type I restriction endonuclease subunit M, partial [Epsilonproteobacteria bacterium]|nr:type I restriction endonuclease subunit M [Campylobacterota bacterium]